MKLFFLAAVLAAATPAFPYTATYAVSYNELYDQGQTSLTDVACSNGEYGLITAGYTTFESLPTFPYIGGAPQISGWESPYCGSCWNLIYTNAQGVSIFINVTAINTVTGSNDTFSISKEAVDKLTFGQGLNTAPITATRLPSSACGL